MTVHYFAMKPESVDGRLRCCRGCPAATRPRNFPGRVEWCSDLPRSHGYLPVITKQVAAACPRQLWGRATEDDCLPVDPRNTADVERLVNAQIWFELHTVAANALTPNWFWTTIARVPCGACRAKVARYHKRRPFPFGDIVAFRRAMWRFHNHVSRTKDKPSRAVTWAAARQKYARWWD